MADCGISAILVYGEFNNASPNHVAPEILSCKPYTQACDLWSIGIITFMLLTGRFPFWDKHNPVLYEKIMKAEYIWPTELEISKEAKDFVDHLLVKQPEKRYLLFIASSAHTNFCIDLPQSKHYNIRGYLSNESLQCDITTCHMRRFCVLVVNT